MRNVPVHGYAQVSDADLWQTATTDIQPLPQQVERYLSDIDREQWKQGEDPYTEALIMPPISRPPTLLVA